MRLLASVEVFGLILPPPALIGACAERGIAITLPGRSCRFRAGIAVPVSGNVLLRRARYRMTDETSDVVRPVIMGKIANQRAPIHSGLRGHDAEVEPAAPEALEAASTGIEMILHRAQLKEDSIDPLRRTEGEAAPTASRTSTI